MYQNQDRHETRNHNVSNSKQPQQHLKPRLRADISCSHYLVWDAGRGLEYILLHRVCILASIYFESFEYGTFFQLMFHKNWRLWRPFEASPFSAHNTYVYGEKLKDMTIWIPVLSSAFVSILNVPRGKLTYYAYKENRRSSSWKVVFITETNSEGLDENVHLCSLISVIKSCTQIYECDSMHTLRSAKPFQNNLSKNIVVWWLTIAIWL